MNQQHFDQFNALIRNEEAQEDLGDSTQYITFTIGAEEYGVNIMSVKEIMGWMPATLVPNQPSYMRGVINMRGVIVPIYDLRARFGSGITEPSPLHVYIVVSLGDRSLGLQVDAVSDILTVSDADLLPVPEMERSIDAEFLTNLVTVNGRMVALLSLDKLFASEHDDSDDL
jgi:purine-binding chemotaxis protein CheW